MKLGGQNKPLVIGSGSGPVTEHNKLKGLSYEESGHTGFQKAEEGKGLSTNDFTDAEKTQLSNLKKAYVFVGSVASMGYMPEYVDDIPDGITPVYNYIGDDILYTQPHGGGAPYQVTCVGFGINQMEDGSYRVYFDVPQNEGIIFYKDLDIHLTIGDDADNTLGTLNTKVFDVYGVDSTENNVRVVTGLSSEIPKKVLWVQCSPVVKIRKGDNIAILTVAGKVFYEVLSHNYGEEMNVLQEEYKAMNAQVQTKADKQMAVPSTVKTGNPLVLSDQLAGESLLSFQIHGAEGGVGDLTDSGKYQIPITIYGKNMFQYLAPQVANGTVVEILENGTIVQGNQSDTAATGAYARGWFRPGFTATGGNGVTVYTGQKVTISADVTLLEAGNSAEPLKTSVNLMGRETGAKQYTSAAFPLNEQGKKQRVSMTYTIIEESNKKVYYPVFALNSNKMQIENIQIQVGGNDILYVPYQEPETVTVLLDAPLGAGETVAVDGMVARDGVSTYVAETSVSPILSIGYYQDINKVIAGLQAMILEA